MLNKKGDGLTISTIIYLILGLLVLVLLVLIFTGQAKSVFETVKTMIQSALGLNPDLGKLVK